MSVHCPALRLLSFSCELPELELDASGEQADVGDAGGAGRRVGTPCLLVPPSPERRCLPGTARLRS